MLLAFLACARRAVHREELAAMLWPDLPERRGIATLNSALHTLRRALEPDLSIGERSSLVVAEGPTYRLALGEDDRWDAEAFLRAARAAISVGTLDALLAAERAHTGVLLPEWTFGSWTEPLRTEIEEAHRAVCVRVAGVLAAQGRHDEAIGRYRILVATEPEREGWHRGLMRMYADAGERALALRQFETLRAILRERLGVEPSRETRELHTELLRDG